MSTASGSVANFFAKRTCPCCKLALNRVTFWLFQAVVMICDDYHCAISIPFFVGEASSWAPSHEEEAWSCSHLWQKSAALSLCKTPKFRSIPMMSCHLEI